MDAGSPEKIGGRSGRLLHSTPGHHRPFLSTPTSRQMGDRFIPDRSAMDFDFAHYLLTESWKEKKESPSAYRELLYRTLFNDRRRIFSFKSKPTAPTKGFWESDLDTASSCLVNSRMAQRKFSQEKILAAPGLLDDYYLNLLDWGCNNVLSIALGNTVYLWNASSMSASTLVSVDEDIGPVTSVSWAPDGKHIAMGLNNGCVQVWNLNANRLVRNLSGMHQSRVGSLAWKDNRILTTGGHDGKIVNNDIRVPSHIMHTNQAHHLEVCGLKWSPFGLRLASGGADNRLHIWDLSMASANSRRNRWIYRFQDHRSSVKALDWCPSKDNFLASGGGQSDCCIKFWNTNTGACLKSMDTGSQVSSLLWNNNGTEILSSHGFSQNQLTLWKYPSMHKITELMHHASPVLFMAKSPNGSTVASAAGDENLVIWNVFATTAKEKRAARAEVAGPFSYFDLIRSIRDIPWGGVSKFNIIRQRMIVEWKHGDAMTCLIRP